MADDTEIRDELPSELNVSGFVGAYEFPDNSRRRVPGYIYLGLGAACSLAWLLRRADRPVLVNNGFLLAAFVLMALGLLCLTSGWKLGLDEKDALAKATGAVGWPIGHASAQMAWRGLRSRPVWRILAYSVEEPPKSRAFVVIDAVDGRTVEQFVEDNPEDWAAALLP